jgi:hypothetical protein
MTDYKNIYQNLSKQAKFVFWIGCFNLIILVFMLFFQPKDVKNFTFIIILTILMIFFNTYKIDCFIKGDCNILGWVFVYLTFFANLSALYRFYSKNYLPQKNT